MDDVWVVTYFKDGDSCVAVFSNEEAARGCYDKVKQVGYEPVVIYHTYVFDKFIIR